MLYQRAKDILSLSEKTVSEIRSLRAGMTGTVSIGLVEGIAPDIAAEWFVGFMKEHPQVHFRILAGRGVGISIFPQTAYIMNDSLIKKEIEAPTTAVDYLFVWRKGHQLSLLEETFIDFVKGCYS